MYAKIRHIITIFIFSSILLTGCNTLQRIQTGQLTTEFDQTFLLYAKHLRWGHFRELTTYMTPEHIGPAMEKITSITLRGIKVSHVEPIAWLLDMENEVMTGDVVVDYYITSSGLIRQTTQHQIWRLNGDIWQLDGGLPDLR